VVYLEVGVVSIQGAVSEHIEAISRAGTELGLSNLKVHTVRRVQELEAVDGLVIPGGESTTISKLLVKFNLYDRVIELAKKDELPIMGTCAGCIVLAHKGDFEVEKTETKLLSLMDMRVTRNAFGRQGESFESDIEIEGFDSPYHAIFIRAPVIEEVWGGCKVLAQLEGKIVMARQKRLIAAAFHPELTDDSRIHKYFLEML
jgi:5'-phosphate synthase pdxT subunit